MQDLQNVAQYDNFVLVNLAFSAYSGLVTLDKSELGVSVDPELVTSGELKTVSRDTLKVFGTLKAKARTACLRYGTSFMGGYAIPIGKWKQVQLELIDVKAEYEQEAARFVANYEQYVRGWADKYAGDRETLLRKAHPQEWVKNRFPARFSGCHLSPASGMEQEMATHVEGMYDSICKEIATDAKQAIRGYERGSKITTKMIGTFGGMVDKIKALSFVNSSLEPLGNTIQLYVDQLFPAGGGKIEKDAQSKIAILLTAMINPDNLKDLSSVLQVNLDKVEKTLSIDSESQQSGDSEEDFLLLDDDFVEPRTEKPVSQSEVGQSVEHTELMETATKETTISQCETVDPIEEQTQDTEEALLMEESEPESEVQRTNDDEDDDFVML